MQKIILDPKLEEYTLFSNKTAIILRIDCMLGAQNTSYKYKKIKIVFNYI